MHPLHYLSVLQETCAAYSVLRSHYLFSLLLASRPWSSYQAGQETCSRGFVLSCDLARSTFVTRLQLAYTSLVYPPWSSNDLKKWYLIWVQHTLQVQIYRFVRGLSKTWIPMWLELDYMVLDATRQSGGPVMAWWMLILETGYIHPY